MAYVISVVRTTSFIMSKSVNSTLDLLKRRSLYRMIHRASPIQCSGNKALLAAKRHDTEMNLLRNDIPEDRKSSLSTKIQADPEMEKGIDFDRLKHDADWTESFGTLASDAPEYKDIELDEKRFPDDEAEDDSFEEPYRRLAKVGRRHSPNWYGRQIEKFGKQGKVYECINMLEVKMLKEDRVMPNEYVFTVLIGVLGRVGYTKKAFKLFKKMTEFHLRPEDPTYTALFNACSNCPWPEYGLKKAKTLKEKMVEKLHQPNQTTYKAMIKAFGRCGDVVTAFGIVDEMIEAHLRIDNEVFSMLLQACISDKEAGLRHAIQVWHRINKLKWKNKLVPEIFQYNLFLRAIRDCGVGDPLLAQQLTTDGFTRLLFAESHDKRSFAETKMPNDELETSGESLIKSDGMIQKSDIIEIQPIENLERLSGSVEQDEHDVVNVTTESWWSYHSEKEIDGSADDEQTSELSTIKSQQMNLANNRIDSGDGQGIINFDTPEKRLTLFGGFEHILTSMEQDHVRPDIRTFTQMIDLIPSNLKAEQNLLTALEKYDVKPDVDFFNLLIRKRNLRRDYIHAKEVLLMLGKHNLVPNNFTFGCLAMGCPRIKDGMQLIADMENAGLNLSVEICNILIKLSRMNFLYKFLVIQKMKELDIKPNEVTIRTIEHHIKMGRDAIMAEEKGIPLKWKIPANIRKDYGLFMKHYKSWLMLMGLQNEPHPWEQFKKPTPEIGDESD